MACESDNSKDADFVPCSFLNKRRTQKPPSKKSKTASRNDRPPIPTRDFNELFATNDGTISLFDEEVPRNAFIENTAGITAENAIKGDIKDDIKELKSMLGDVMRQVAQIKVLIKFQRLPSVSQREDDNYLEVLQSYGLPISSKDKLDELEKTLRIDDKKKHWYALNSFLLRLIILIQNDSTFQLNALIRLNGDSGTLAARKIIKSLVHHIIKPETLALFTWTGKTASKHSRKFAFKEYTQTLAVIYEKLLAADSNYTKLQFSNDCVNKIMKHAFNADQSNTK